MKELKIGVNIDHIATLRQQRFTDYPDPLTAALLLEQCGVDSITVHLREDRRHIQDKDVLDLKRFLRVPINLEMAATDEMVSIACSIQPAYCCLVPEKREELTTEGGLNLFIDSHNISNIIKELQKSKIRVSLFIDPNVLQVKMAKDIGAEVIEINTGSYSEASSLKDLLSLASQVEVAAKMASELGLSVHAGHGLNYQNVMQIAKIKYIEELNIGHSIISRAVFDGLGRAYIEMKEACLQVRTND